MSPEDKRIAVLCNKNLINTMELFVKFLWKYATIWVFDCSVFGSNCIDTVIVRIVSSIHASMGHMAVTGFYNFLCFLRDRVCFH